MQLRTIVLLSSLLFPSPFAHATPSLSEGVYTGGQSCLVYVKKFETSSNADVYAVKPEHSCDEAIDRARIFQCSPYDYTHDCVAGEGSGRTIYPLTSTALLMGKRVQQTLTMTQLIYSFAHQPDPDPTAPFVESGNYADADGLCQVSLRPIYVAGEQLGLILDNASGACQSPSLTYACRQGEEPCFGAVCDECEWESSIVPGADRNSVTYLETDEDGTRSFELKRIN